MKFYKHITEHKSPDGATYVQMVGYHSLEDAYHRLLERGDINIPRHEYNSFDFAPGDQVDVNDLDGSKFNFGSDKYDAAVMLHEQGINPVVAPDLSSSEPASSPATEPASSPAPQVGEDS